MEVSRLDVLIPYDEVLVALRFNRHLTHIDLKTENLIKALIDKAYPLINCAGIYQHFLIDKKDKEEIFLENVSSTIKSKDIANLFKKSHKATIFAVTIGFEIITTIKSAMKQKRMTEALILDAIASVAVEELMENLNRVVRQEARLEGYRLTRRFSPGYGDLGLENQKMILEILKAEKIGISLTDSFIMLPEKSVTSLLGWEK